MFGATGSGNYETSIAAKKPARKAPSTPKQCRDRRVPKRVVEHGTPVGD